MILVQCFFGREQVAIEIEDDPYAQMTYLKAMQERAKWSRGIRRFHPRGYRIEDEVHAWSSQNGGE